MFDSWFASLRKTEQFFWCFIEKHKLAHLWETPLWINAKQQTVISIQPGTFYCGLVCFSRQMFCKALWAKSDF